MDIFTTMITPYHEDGSVDYETAEKYVDWYFESGITGIFAVCQSSEIFYLTLEERTELNRRVYARAKALEKQHGRRFPPSIFETLASTRRCRVAGFLVAWTQRTHSHRAIGVRSSHSSRIRAGAASRAALRS